MKKHKVSKAVWFDESEERLPELTVKDWGAGGINPNEVNIYCCLEKPKKNAKRIRITVEEV